ncbi:hypothetical protein ARMSODRAFT_980951 [Armillaria solidipes]|uniref:Uncharacterized protein n=1 Tax=Armillaria solidipes TaxID=1076256 RepID=A0A2H3ATZ7_9AGAR|nr:hypothetical protein ARMSODRAFT_980951 [Armillaria solidipes]
MNIDPSSPSPSSISRALVPIDAGRRQREYDMELDLSASSSSMDLVVLKDDSGMSDTHQSKRHAVAGPNRQSHDEMLGALRYSQDWEHEKNNIIRLLKAQHGALTEELKRYQQYFPVPKVIYADLENNKLPAAELKRQVSLLHSEREVMLQERTRHLMTMAEQQKDVDKLLKQRAKDERLLTQQREYINQVNQRQSIDGNILQAQKESLEKQNKFIAGMMSRMEVLKEESTKTHEEMDNRSAELEALKTDNAKTCVRLAELEKAIVRILHSFASLARSDETLQKSKDNEIVSLQGRLAVIAAPPSQSSMGGIASTPENPAGPVPSATQNSSRIVPLPRKISTPKGTSRTPTKIQRQQIKVPISSWREASPAVDPAPSHLTESQGSTSAAGSTASQLAAAQSAAQEGAAAEPAVADPTAPHPAGTPEHPSMQENATMGIGGMPSNLNLGDLDQLIQFLASCLKQVVVSDPKESLETGQGTLAPKKMTVRMEQQERMGRKGKNEIQTFIRRWWCKFYKMSSIEEFIVYKAQEQQIVLAFKDKQGPGPTNDDLILDFSHGFASSKWNRAIFSIMIPMIQGELKKEPALPAVDSDYIVETLLGLLRRSRVKWAEALPRYKTGTTQLETGEEVVQRMAETGEHVHKVAASQASKVRKHKRRVMTAKKMISIKTKNGDVDLQTWQLFLKMLQMLDVNGMSSEEDVTRVIGGITQTMYTIKLCIWRNGDVVKYLEDIDGASPQFTGKGSHPAHRERETVPRMNEMVNAPQGLPRALYDPGWLAELDEYEQGDLCIFKETFELLKKVVEAADMPEMMVEEVD